MSKITQIKDVIVNYPIILSLFIYIVICLIIYFTKPKSIFQHDSGFDKETTNEEDINRREHLLKKNINVIFIILPFVIYGIVCAISSTMIRSSYCDMLKQKEMTIKELIKQCKN